MGAYISRPEAAVSTTVGSIARGLGGGVGLGDCAGKRGPRVVFQQERQHPFQEWEEGREALSVAPGIGSVIRGHAVQHKGKHFNPWVLHCTRSTL